ncbi:MAG: glycoside hydrolase family 6 protein [Solirubrobacteraceae bacterium]
MTTKDMRRAAAGMLALILLALGMSGAASAATHPPIARIAAQQCAENGSSTRDLANPLALRQAPGNNPLHGAHFSVDGPAHGAAAGAIASLLGINPSSLPDSESWAGFASSLSSAALGGRLAASPSLAQQVHELAKIASEPEVQRLSAYSRGGGPGGVFLQTEKLLCKNGTADRGAIPLLDTYFLHPAAGQCPGPGALSAAGPSFRRRVNELSEAIGRRPVVLLLETDSIGVSRCIQRAGSLPTWESFLRYEISTLSRLPHAVIYTEAGYSDANSVRYTAQVLNAIGVGRIRGFYTNDTHLRWTSNEVRWATKISRLTHGAHFIINTAANGNGPLLNRHPSTQGIENLCNPPGRALGPAPTTQTGVALADAWLWTSPPGNSSGCGGGPPGGVFWPARAISLAEHANGKLGPGFPSHPY